MPSSVTRTCPRSCATTSAPERDGAVRSLLGVKLRRQPLPDDARAALPLDRGEKVIAAAQLADGDWVVAGALLDCCSLDCSEVG